MVVEDVCQVGNVLMISASCMMSNAEFLEIFYENSSQNDEFIPERDHPALPVAMMRT